MRILERYCFVFLPHAEGLYRDVRGNHIELRSGDLIFVFPDIGHTYGPLPGRPWNEVYFIATGPIFDLWLNTGTISRDRPVIHLEQEEYWYQRFTNIIHKDSGPPESRALRAIARLQSTVLDALAAAHQAQVGASRAAWLETAQQLLSEPVENRWLTPREVASRVGLSYDNFRKLFSRHTGSPPQQFQKQKRIEYACAAIYEGNKPLKEIAADLEFCDVFHFSKAFKQIVGASPSQFRKRVLGH